MSQNILLQYGYMYKPPIMLTFVIFEWKLFAKQCISIIDLGRIMETQHPYVFKYIERILKNQYFGIWNNEPYS